MITMLAFTGVVCLWWKLLCIGFKASFGVLKVFLAIFLTEAMIIGILYVSVIAALLFSVDKWLIDTIFGVF